VAQRQQEEDARAGAANDWNDGAKAGANTGAGWYCTGCGTYRGAATGAADFGQVQGWPSLHPQVQAGLHGHALTFWGCTGFTAGAGGSGGAWGTRGACGADRDMKTMAVNTGRSFQTGEAPVTRMPTALSGIVLPPCRTNMPRSP
jgi:hypothetical protein